MLGCSVFGWLFTPTTALHALTMGAIGTMVMAVTTRVALGHTGRPLQAARATVAAYWLLMIAVLIRVLGPLPGIGYLLMIDLSAAGWIASFDFCLDLPTDSDPAQDRLSRQFIVPPKKHATWRLNFPSLFCRVYFQPGFGHDDAIFISIQKLSGFDADTGK